MGKRSRVNTGNLQTITQHRLALGRREKKSQKADLPDISLSPNFQLSNSLASNFLVALLITSSFIDVVNAMQETPEKSASPLKYNDKGGFNEERFNYLLGKKMVAIPDQEKMLIYNAVKQMPLRDRKMFALCLLKMNELDQNSGIVTHSTTYDVNGAFAAIPNSDLSHPDLRMLINLDRETKAREIGMIVGHESMHCAQFTVNEQTDSVVELSKKKFKKGGKNQRQKAAMSYNLNSLGNSEETKRCEEFFYEMKDYAQEMISQGKSSPLPPERQQYFIRLGKVVYDNLKDVNYIGMDKAMLVYRKNFREKFSTDLDNAIKTNGALADKAYLTVGMTFVDIFAKRISEWEQMYQGVFCTEAIANFGDIPEAVRKEFHPKMNEFVLTAKETIFNKGVNSLGTAYRKMFDSIFPAKHLGAEEISPDATVKLESAKKVSGKQGTREL